MFSDQEGVISGTVVTTNTVGALRYYGQTTIDRETTDLIVYLLNGEGLKLDSTRTDKNGKFQFKYKKAGSFRLSVKQKYLVGASSNTYELKENENLNVVLGLKVLETKDYFDSQATISKIEIDGFEQRENEKGLWELSLNSEDPQIVIFYFLSTDSNGSSEQKMILTVEKGEVLVLNEINAEINELFQQLIDVLLEQKVEGQISVFESSSDQPSSSIEISSSSLLIESSSFQSSSEIDLSMSSVQQVLEPKFLFNKSRENNGMVFLAEGLDSAQFHYDANGFMSDSGLVLQGGSVMSFVTPTIQTSIDWTSFRVSAQFLLIHWSRSCLPKYFSGHDDRWSTGSRASTTSL